MRDEINKAVETLPIGICKDKAEVIKSETVLRVIEIIEKLNPEKKNTSEKQEKPISIIYSRFASWYPLSEKNINRLIQFFENPKNQELAKEIMSKMHIKEWNNNSDFINSFLKSSNSSDLAEQICEIARATVLESSNDIKQVIQGHIDNNMKYRNNPSKLINYVIEKLKNYPYKVAFVFELIKELEKNYDPYKLFVYKKEGKRWFMIRWDEKLVITDNGYTSIKHIKHWIFLWLKKEIKELDNEKVSWDILAFNSWVIDTIWTIDDIRVDDKYIPTMDQWNLNFTLKSWKTGCKRIIKNETGKILEDWLEANYDKIEVKNWITFASINLDSWKKNLEVHTKNWNKKLFENIDLYSYIEPNMIMIKKDWLSYYKVEENWDIIAINYLQNINSIIYPKNIESLLSNHEKSNPVFIKNNNWEIYLVEPDGNIIILEVKNVSRVTSSVEQDSIKFKIWNKTYYCSNDKRELYIFDTSKPKK